MCTSLLEPNLNSLFWTQCLDMLNDNAECQLISLQLHIQLFGIVYRKPLSAYQNLHVLLLKSFIFCFIPNSILELGMISVFFSIYIVILHDRKNDRCSDDFAVCIVIIRSPWPHRNVCIMWCSRGKISNQLTKFYIMKTIGSPKRRWKMIILLHKN